MNVEEAVIKIIKENLDIDSKTDIELDAHIIHDLGGDSLSAVEIVMEIEEEFDIEIDDGEVEDLESINALVDLIKDRI
jgi:acyl carrier protein